MARIKNIVVLIPALDPSDGVVNFIQKLAQLFENIVVVNDGSSIQYEYIFKKLQEQEVHVLKHNINLGKGRALKTGINYILNELCDVSGIVTADSDGQHSVEDILKIAGKIKPDDYKLILGARNFNQKDVPLKSSFGNKLTQKVFSLFCGINISDTQTGLRAFNVNVARQALAVSGERFEYETNVLIACKRSGISIIEMPIATIYLDNNKGTHFNPILDSFLIYRLFAGYFAASFFAFVMDIVLFNIFYVAIFQAENNGIVFSTIAARGFSSLCNYFCNKYLVFKSSSTQSLPKYYILAIVQMFVSGYSVKGLFFILGRWLVPIKIIVDTLLFIVNFGIQREWVFRK